MATRPYQKVKRNGVELWVPSGSEPLDRRQFVTAAGGLLAGAGLSACGGGDPPNGPPPPPPATGSVRVLVTGLTSGVANGGTVTVTPLDGQDFDEFTVTIPASGDSGAVPDVPVGTYRGTYTAPANHALAAGQSATQDIEVVENQTATATWIVELVDGTLQINVTGLQAGATSGGSVSVLRTDISGQTPTTIPVPGSGSVTTGVDAGTYQVTYTPPSGYTVTAGVTNPQSVVVAPGATGTANFAVTVVTGCTPGAAPNIYGHGFEDSSSGSFVTGSGNPMPLGTAPLWELDSTGAPRCSGSSTKSIRAIFAATTGNVGNPFYFILSPARTSVYVRFAMKHSVNFNANNDDEQKVCRLIGPNFSNQAGTLIVVGRKNAAPLAGTFAWKWDTLDTSPFVGNLGANVNLPPPNMNNLQDQWVWVEIFSDISTDNALRVQIWINGVQYFDRTTAKSNQGRNYGTIQFDGTINSMANQSTLSLDEIGISSAPMGIP